MANEAKMDWKRTLVLEMTAYWINVVYLTLLLDRKSVV